MLLLAWWRRGRITRTDVMRMVPFLVVAGVLGLLTVVHEDRIAINTVVPRPEGAWSRLASMGWCVWFYLFKVALPLRLSMVYPRGDVNPVSLVSWLPLLGLLTVAIAAWILRKTGGRAVLVALGVYMAMLLPTFGVVDNAYFFYSFVADHFQYFALAAPLCLAVAAAARLTGPLRQSPRTAPWALSWRPLSCSFFPRSRGTAAASTLIPQNYGSIPLERIRHRHWRTTTWVMSCGLRAAWTRRSVSIA